MKCLLVTSVVVGASVLFLPICAGSFFGSATEASANEARAGAVGKPYQNAAVNEHGFRQRNVLVAPLSRNSGSVRGMIKMFVSIIIDKYVDKIVEFMMGVIGGQEDLGSSWTKSEYKVDSSLF
ncbi:hypothetical protein BIW11_09723 [Tropilaelaps mercedesae]|uniref:Uncharacterized protein n=1 Tax=Tropilaelaps mercedesae TaxID=418985 RepID=A0A1V9XIS6_9ACAR|nr:hypothetical protein BIW11_09723 [Tropilaelaps mercedesae]